VDDNWPLGYVANAQCVVKWSEYSGVPSRSAIAHCTSQISRCQTYYAELLFDPVCVKDHTMSQVLEEDPWRGRIGDQIGSNRPLQFVIRVGLSDNQGYGGAIRRNVGTIIRVQLETSMSEAMLKG